MPANDVSIHIEAEDRSRQAFRQAEQSLQSLENQTRDLQGATRQAMQAFERTQRGAADLERGFTGANRGAGVLTRSLGGLGSVLGGLGIAAVTAEVFDFGKESVNAAVKLESYTNALTALHGDARIAGEVLKDLQELSELPGISFDQATQGAIRLKTVGIEGERAVDTLRELGNSLALVGSTDLSGILLGLTQIASAGKVTTEEIRQITERSGLAAQAIQDAWGSLLGEDIQSQLDAAGQGVQDFVDILVNQLSEQARASADSTANAFSNLGNATFRLQATVGELFIPTVREAVLGLTNFLDAIRAGVKDTEQLPESIQDIVAGAKDLYDSLQNAVELFSSSVGPEVHELAASLSTLLGGVLDLVGSIYDVLTPVWKIWGEVNATVIALITKLAQDVSSLIGVITDFVDWVARAWKEEDKFTESTQQATQAIEEVKEAAAGASGSFQEYAGSLRTVLEELANVNAEIEQKKTRLDELKADGLEPTDASLQQIVRRIALLEERSKSLTGNLPDLSQALEDVNAQLEQKSQQLNEMVGGGKEAKASAEQLTRQIETLKTLAALLNTQIANTTTELTETAPATETAAQAVENYSLTLARLKARAEDVRDNISNVLDADNIKSVYQKAINASDAYYDAVLSNLQEHLSAEEAGSEAYNKIQTEIFETEREREKARQGLLDESEAYEREVSQRRADARIDAAERARAVEVDAFKTAEASGESYAQQLARLETVSQRRAFSELVEKFQQQGLSFDEARAKAEPYLDVIGVMPAHLSAADAAYGHFASTLVRESDRSADAVLNLLLGVQALGAEIGSLADDQIFRLDSSLERSLLNEQRYFQQNSVGLTIEDDQARAGQQGRAFVQALFRRQDREAEQAARESEQAFNELVRNVDSGILLLTDALSGLDGSIGDLTSTVGSVDFTALLSGNPFATVFELGKLFIDLGQDVHERRLENLREEAEAVALIERVRANAAADEGIQAAAQSRGARAISIIEGSDVFSEDAQQLISHAFQQITDSINIDNIDVDPNFLSNAFELFINSFRTAMETAGNDFERAIERDADPTVISNRFNELVEFTNDYFTSEVERVRAIAKQTGNDPRNAVFALIQERDRILNDATNELRLAQPQIGRSRFSQYQLNQQLQQNRTTEEIDTEYLATFAEGDPNAQLPIRGEDATPELTEAETLAPVINRINEGIGLINASILSIETQIAQSNDPAEIAQLLSRIPDLIQQKYQMLRDALDARYNAGEISVDVYNASLQELESNQAREIEQHSDVVLANTVRAIDEDVQLIDAEISALQTQSDQLSEPDEIVALLSQIPELITEKYRKLRHALDQKYAAGEISVDAYNAALTALTTTETAETERHSDAILAQTLANIDDDVQLIDANIGALQLAVEQSDDPEAIAGLLDAIKLLVADKYTRLRERLDELHAAEEISTDAYNAALTGLSTAESRALADIDTQALNAISEEAQEQVRFINGAIENLRLSFQLTDDPTETQRILDAIKVLVRARFDVLIDELNAIKDTLTDDQFSQALKGLQLGRQVALENINTEKFDAISAAAAHQVDFINGSIENLRLALQLTDDPTESQQILDAIKVLTAARFQILRDELNAIKDTLKPEEFEQALKGINLGEQLALENLDTEKFDAISAEADRQVERINSNIENLRLSLQLTDDSAEQQQILTSIKVLTIARFDVLREELVKIKDSLDPEVYNQALKGLNLGEQLAIQNLNTEKLKLISAEAQKQVDAINGSIENLRLSFELTDDPAERQQILDAIQVLTAARFDVLRDELEKIKDNLDDGEYERALRGLNLGEQVALRNIDTEKFEVISDEAQRQVGHINGAIDNLRLSLQLADEPAEIQQILDAIKILTVARFDVLIEELENVRENLKPGQYEQALRGLELGKQIAVDNIDTEKFGAISAEAQKQVGAINESIENLRLSLQITDAPAKIQEILDAIKLLTAARFDTLIEELHEIRNSFDNAEDFDRALRGLELGKTIALDNISTEKFDAISAAAKKQADFISGSIENLRLALQLTDDPTEVQAILNSIKLLTAKHFDVLIQGLKNIEDSFDDPAVFRQALEGLELGKEVALRGIDDESIGVTLTGIGNQISGVDSELAQLFDELGEQTTATGVRESIDRLRTAITTKYQLMRDKINESADKEEDKARQIAAVDIAEGRELEQLGERGLGQFNSLVDTAQFLLDNATEAEFATRRQNLINAINTFYDERIAFINSQDLTDTDRANMLAVADIQRNIALDAVPQMHASVTERLELEKELQDKIQDLRDDSIEAEADRLETIADLQERHNQRIVDLEEELNRDIEDLRRDRFDTAREDALDYQRDLEDLQTEYARKLFGDSVISFGDLTAEQRRRLEQDTNYQQELFDLNLERDRDRQDRNVEFGVLRPGTSGYNLYRQQLEGGQLTDENLIRQLFGTQGRDDFIDFEQGTQDADQRLAQGIIEATTQYETSISENTLATEALTAELHRLQGMSPEDSITEETATLLSDTAVLASATAKTESDAAMTNAATAQTQQALTQTQATSIETLQSASLLMNESALNLQTAVDAFALIPESFDDVVTAFQRLPDRLLDAIPPLVASYAQSNLPISSVVGQGLPEPATSQTDSGRQLQLPGSQEMRITLVGDFGDGFIQKVAEALVTLDAEGRSIR